MVTTFEDFFNHFMDILLGEAKGDKMVQFFLEKKTFDKNGSASKCMASRIAWLLEHSTYLSG
jgi:hypothetical protein